MNALSTNMPQRLALGQGPAALRTLLREQPFVIAPGVHDLYSLRVVEEGGFDSAAISGAVLSHVLLGMPDVGLVTLTEAVEHCRRIVRAASIPVTADADAGYGNALGVYHTVQLFEEAGAAGINLEELVEKNREVAVKRVKGDFLLKKIAEVEEIKIADEDIQRGYQRIADQYRMTLDEVKKYFKRREEILPFMNELHNEKVLNFLREQAKYTIAAAPAAEQAEA